MTKEWTPEERRAFGEKMAERRAAKRANSTPEGDDMAATATPKQYAGRDDVPAGVRPLAPRAAAGGIRDAAEVAGLVQTPDTGAAPSVGLEVEGSVIGAGANGPRSRPSLGTVKRESAGAGVLFSDTKDDGGTPQRLARRGSAGPAEPSGLPCTCVMPTRARGAAANITWCMICGGERDRVARPENALRKNRVREIMDQEGVTANIEAIVKRVLGQIDYQQIAELVVQELGVSVTSDGYLVSDAVFEAQPES